MTGGYLGEAELLGQSPYGKFLEHCARDELAYQVEADGTAIFYPRALDLPWAVSAGLGEVYSSTVVRHKGEPPFALVLVDMDEGFRLMSRVDSDAPETVRIGDRVRVKFRSLAEGQAPLPVFVAEGAGA